MAEQPQALVLDSDLLGPVFARFWEVKLKIASSNICRMALSAAAALALHSQAARRTKTACPFGYPDFSVAWLLPRRFRDGRWARWLITQSCQLPATSRQLAKSR